MNLQKFTLLLSIFVFLSLPLEIEAKKSWGSKKSYSSKKSSKKSVKSIFGSTKKKSSSSYYGSSSKKSNTSSSKSYGSNSKKGSYTTPKTKPIASSSFDKARVKKIKKEKSTKAYKEYKQTKTKFKEKPKVVQTDKIKVQKIRKKSFNLGSDDYYSRKSSYYDNNRKRDYIYNHRSNFGIWDAVFLWALLDNPSSGATHVYNHSNDAGVQEWLRNAKDEAKDNEELRQKVSLLEGEVAKMQAGNLQKDETYLPKSIEPDLAFSENFVEKNRDVFYESKDESSSSWVSVLIPVFMILFLGYWLIFVRKS